MGATKTALAVIVVALSSIPAHAESCLGRSPSGSFPVCFDVGNRMWVSGGLLGVAAGVDIRHKILFDDEPDLVWKLSHQLGRVAHGTEPGEYQASLYAGRYIRHARDGHVVLPLGRPHKIFLPFDIGAEAELGRVASTTDSGPLELGVVRLAALVELARSTDFRRRLTLGVAARWDMHLVDGVVENRVAPLSMAAASLYLESQDGRMAAELGVESGMEWSSQSRWGFELRAKARLERTLIAVNDRPVSLVLGATYRRTTSELVGDIGLRVALFQHRDLRSR